MKKIINTIKEYENIIYYFGIFLVCIKIFTERTTLFNINDVYLNVIFLACFFIKMILQKYSKREMIITIISGVISCLVGIITKEYGSIYLYFIIFASKNIKIKNIVKISFITITILLLFSMIKYGIDSIFKEVPIIYRNTGEARFTFYLNHPNIVAGLITWIAAQYIYLRFEKIGIKDYLVLFIIFSVVYYFTLSRTAYITSILLIVLTIISKIKLKKNYIAYVAKYSFVVLAILTIGLGYMYNSCKEYRFMKEAENFVSGRISLLSLALDKYGVSIFPRKIDLTQEEKWVSGRQDELYLDSLYSRIYVKYGIIYLVWIMYISVHLNKNMNNKNAIFILLFAVIACMERYMLLPVIGFSLLFFRDFLWEEEKSKKIVLSQYIKSNLNAGPKAKVDIENILHTKFGFEVKTLPLTMEICKNRLKRKIQFLKKTIYVGINCFDADIIIVQTPFSNKISILNKNKNKIAIIHDIEGLRNQNMKELKEELKFYDSCKAIVAHNPKMKNFLIENGINQEKIYTLELFDYLCDKGNENKNEFNKKNLSVAYTGNLDKAPFITQLEHDKMDFILNLYGMLNIDISNKKIKYKGKFLPEELPHVIEENLGLVWDGNLDESDEEESFKKYTKYNNPHKLSCYIAAEMPVIVWKKAAISELVEKYNIGYTISNVYEINNINFEDYDKKIENIKRISQKVKNGYFTEKIMKEVLKDIEKDDN